MPNHEVAIERLLEGVREEKIECIAHRVTHGGEGRGEIASIDANERRRLETLLPRAPLHMPHNLKGIDLCMPFGAEQFACYDTGFHADLSPWNRQFPIPLALNFRRAGFHGLNFGYITSQLHRLLPSVAQGRIAIAHLGSGSSLCLVQNGRSIETTMGWTPLGGIPMGTRSGDLDPGIVLERTQHHAPEELIDLFWRQSGLLALSGGRSSQMDRLLVDPADEAQFAIEYFSRRVSQAISALAVADGGLDALIFTGGIGENASEIRSLICSRLGFLGFQIDEQSNREGGHNCHTLGSKPILRVVADEERQMCALVDRHLGVSSQRGEST